MTFACWIRVTLRVDFLDRKTRSQTRLPCSSTTSMSFPVYQRSHKMTAFILDTQDAEGSSHAEPLCSFSDVLATLPFSAKALLSEVAAGPAFTLCDRSCSCSRPRCRRGSPSPSVPLSLLFMLLQVSFPPYPRASGSICILFLGPLVSLIVHSWPPVLI